MKRTSKKQKRNIIGVIFTTALFILFATVSISVVFMGADVYGSTVRRMDTSFELDTTLLYISTKVRQSSDVRVGEIGDTQAIVISHHVSDLTFETWIFHNNGVVREAFVNAENAHSLSTTSGQAIVEVHEIIIEQVLDNLVRVTAITYDGYESSVLLHV